MYRHILIPTDGSPLSLKAAKTGARLAKDLKAKVTAVYVIPPYTPPSGSEAIVYAELYSPKKYKADMERHADEALSKVRAAVEKESVECETVSSIERSPWEGIIKTAQKKKCDAIVMASHGRRGVSALLLGSETQKVLTHSKTPVLVCR